LFFLEILKELRKLRNDGGIPPDRNRCHDSNCGGSGGGG
jgi:hypothetical protein